MSSGLFGIGLEREYDKALTERFRLTDAAIQKSLDTLAADHVAIAGAIEIVGYPASRRREHSFDSLARIVMGQQLSTKAATTIAERVRCRVGGNLNAPALMSLPPDQLREAGLSRQKIGYLQSLADAVISGKLCLDRLSHLADDEVESAITAIRGFGRWSAHMYMMFSLGRPDIWPSGDLAVRVAFGRIMGWEQRPDEKTVIHAGTGFSPHRSALALLCWHYYSEAPL